MLLPKIRCIGLLISLIFCGVGIHAQSITARFSAEDVCAGDTMHFVNTSMIPDSLKPVKYLWRFGDGLESTEENPTHFFKNVSIDETQPYNVFLIVRSLKDTNVVDSTARTVIVHGFPNPDFTYSSSSRQIGGKPYYIVNLIPKYADVTNTYSWVLYMNNGDSLVSNEVSPEFKLELDSSQIAPSSCKHTIESKMGCISSATMEFTWSISVQNFPTQALENIPNPANGRIVKPTGVTKMVIYDLSGKQMAETESSEVILNPGIYFIQFSAGSISANRKIIVY